MNKAVIIFRINQSYLHIYEDLIRATDYLRKYPDHWYARGTLDQLTTEIKMMEREFLDVLDSMTMIGTEYIEERVLMRMEAARCEVAA